MVNWEIKADRGDRSPIRARARGGGHQSKPRADREKTPQPTTKPKPADPRGSPIANKLGRHGAQAWTSIPILHPVVHVRTPSPPTLFAVTTCMHPCKPPVPLSRPDPTTARPSPTGDGSCPEQGPQHIGFLVSQCIHRCTKRPRAQRLSATVTPKRSSAHKALRSPSLCLVAPALTRPLMASYPPFLHPSKGKNHGDFTPPLLRGEVLLMPPHCITGHPVPCDTL
jgi:hypothetical protein